MVDEMTGVERVVADSWIEGAIGAAAAELDAISSGISSRVYLSMAPEGVPYPYIVYQCQDDPRDIRGIGTGTFMTETLYLVKVVAAADYTVFGDIFKVINDALTTSIGGVPAVGGRVLSCIKERGWSMSETADGKTLNNLGAMYKLQVQGSSDYVVPIDNNDGTYTVFDLTDNGDGTYSIA